MNDAQQPVFQIQRMYLKDMSLEIPHAPRIFLENQQPTVEIQLDTASEQVGDGVYEIAVTATVTTKVGADTIVFLIEAKEAGIFEIRHIPQEQMEIVLNVVCANIVYPYLRANVADLILRAGFPPIHLAEINFEALHQQRLAQQQAQSAQQPNAGAQPQGEEPHAGIILPGRLQ